MGIDRWKRMAAGSQRKEKMEADTLFELQLKKEQQYNNKHKTMHILHLHSKTF